MGDASAGQLKLSVFPDRGPLFELPEWFRNQSGRVSVMTPYATTIVTNKAPGSIAPFSHNWNMVVRHYAWPEEMTYNEVRHEHLHPDKLRFKPWGEDAKIYQVTVQEEGRLGHD